MREKPLRSVSASERAPRKSRKLPTVLQAVETGDFLAELEAMHRRIAAAVTDPNTPARDLAALMRRQLEISKEIQVIKAGREEDEVGRAASTADEAFDASAI